MRLSEHARHLALNTFCAVGASHLGRWFSRDRVLILMYHGFVEPPQEVGIVNKEGNHLSLNSFDEQMSYLREYHAVISLREYIEARNSGGRLPHFSVILTMDDGYESNYELAFPVLKRYSMPATIFVTTEFVDENKPLWPDRVEWALNTAIDGVGNLPHFADLDLAVPQDPFDRRLTASTLVSRLKDLEPGARIELVDDLEKRLGVCLEHDDSAPRLYKPLTWEQIKEMEQSGIIEFGNHTHTHPILARCNSSTQGTEVSAAHDILAKHLREPPDLFCYPNGGTSDFTPETISILQGLGYKCALTTSPGVNTLHTDQFRLNRTAVHNGLSIQRFVVNLYGGMSGFLKQFRLAE